MPWNNSQSKSRSPSKRAAFFSKQRPAGVSHWPLFLNGILLSLFGLLMIYSSSAVMGMQRYGDGLFYVKKHGIFLLVGWLLYFIAAQIPWVRLAKWRVPILSLGFLLLLLVLLPGVGFQVKGSQRWISLGFMGFQPSELARLILVFYLAATLTIRSDRLDSFNKGFMPLLIVTGALMLLLLLQPDFGGAMSVFLLSVSLWFLGGVPMAYLGGLFILTTPAILLLAFKAEYRARRMFTFLNPYQDAQGSGFQVIQSFLAFFQGGWTGVGIGNSQQKLFYLPEAHNDFIFSVIGEELGVIGVFLVVSLFTMLVYCGSKITKAQMSRFGYYLGAGVTVFLVLPAILNMMVTMGLLPTKGLTLPFFSSGGSSLLVNLFALGILQSLYLHRDEDPIG